jgi:disease resistance protein RPS2
MKFSPLLDFLVSALQTISSESSTHHFYNLLEITISHCHKLQNITWVLKLEALEKLCIYHCDELEQVVQETVDTVRGRQKEWGI